jgi:cellulose synthase (UDP-forming)
VPRIEVAFTLTGIARDQMIAKLYTGTYSQDVIELDKSAIAGRLWMRAFGGERVRSG